MAKSISLFTFFSPEKTSACPVFYFIKKKKKERFCLCSVLFGGRRGGGIHVLALAVFFSRFVFVTCVTFGLFGQLEQVLEAMDSFPIPVDPERLPGVYQMAPTTKESMGVTPYLIVRPEGNILIDVPRYVIYKIYKYIYA